MSPPNDTFSTSAEDAISRSINVKVEETFDYSTSSKEFEDFYEIDRISKAIRDGNFKRIALQFPDELLHDSVPIYRLLKSKVGFECQLYVLADTSYGSCCVDEVAAQHVDADAMVHYGHACMSQTYRLPVFYVFGRRPIDVEDCVMKLIEVFDRETLNGETGAPSLKNVAVRHEVAYTSAAGSIADRVKNCLEPRDIRVFLQPIPLASYPRDVKKAGPEGTDINFSPINEHAIFYVGGESLGLTNLLMTHSFNPVYAYDPKTRIAKRLSTTNKLLMRRYAVVQKARDADVFGILVGTLGVGSYLPLISHLRGIISKARKKSYTISVGKLNPAKLANFLEIECFVLVACPENSLVEAKEFLRPIVTPFELEIALQVESEWTGRYVLDFENLLNNESKAEPRTNKEEYDPDQPKFSLVTGKYRHAKNYGDQPKPEDNKNTENTSVVVLRNQESALLKVSDSAAGHFLVSRTFQGLETRLGEDKPSVLEQGRSGIARGYGENGLKALRETDGTF